MTRYADYVRNVKGDYGFGKEYYAVYNDHGNSLMELVAEKIDTFYPNARKNAWVSIPGTVFKLIDLKADIFVEKHDLLLIHKKSFKRHLKKALSKSRVRYR